MGSISWFEHCSSDGIYCLNCNKKLLSQVDWEHEKNCLQGISAALGNFYAMHPPLLPNPSGDGLQFYKRSTHLVASDDGIDFSDNGGISYCSHGSYSLLGV